MAKVAYNNCYGGFTLSKEASKLLNERKGYKPEDSKYINPECGFIRYLPRHDKDLITVIEEMEENGKDPSGDFSKIRLTEVEGKYIIDEDDGMETVVESDVFDWIDTKE